MNKKMLSSPRRLRRAFLAPVLTFAAAALAAASIASNVPVPGMKVPAALAGATVTGQVPASTILTGTLALAPSNRAGLKAYGDAVSNPQSPLFHHFLTPAQIGTLYGASANTFNTAVSYLKSKGLSILRATSTHSGIIFSGRVDKIESAFSIKLNTYAAPKRTKGPTTFFSYATTPQVPSSFGSQVVVISGLQNAYRPRHASTLTPSQTRTLYDVAPLYDTAGEKGQGINIGITDLGGYDLQNTTLFFNMYLPGLTPTITKVSVDGGNGETVTPDGEADLDIQLVLSQASQCHLYIYDTATTGDDLAALTREADDDTVDVITESYAYQSDETGAAFVTGLHDQHLIITAEGITYLHASGDDGTDLDGANAGDYPDMDPDTLAVGGTVATVDAQGNRVSEDGWVGSGSGWSTLNVPFNVLPSYQVGKGVPTNIPFRLFPDVALHASGANLLFSDPSYTSESDFAYYAFISEQPTVFSGTSASSPVFAGQLGIVLQGLVAAGGADLAPNGRPRLGRINDFIYGLDSDSGAFDDITTGDTGQLPNGQEAVGGVGWDFVTGLGAPSASGLLNAYLANVGVPVGDAPNSATLLTLTNPTLTLGTVTSGSAASLLNADGFSYVIQSVRQPGVGQVAASTIAIPLQTTAVRRSAVLNLTMQLPTTATGYLYLLNANTGNYDLVDTVAGKGAMTTTTLALDIKANTYIVDPTPSGTGFTGGTVTAIVRSIVPTRLGTTPIKLTIDQLSVTERVPKG